MYIPNGKHWVAAALYGVAMLVAAGCSGRSEKDFMLAEDRARPALEQALNAWQNGKSAQITDASPGVVVADSRWKNGAKLARYEILKSEQEGAYTWFTVKLTLLAPSAEKTVRYVVVGIDPLWVYSEEEFNCR
jgi:hypothetical protein